MTKNYERNHPRKALGSGHVGRLEEELPNIDSFVCKHDGYCSVKRFLDKAHCSLDYAKDCQTYRFYQKYGEDGNHLGV